MGLPAIIGDRPYSLTAVAHAHAEVRFVTRDVFSRLMLSEPALATIILKVLAAEVHGARAAFNRRPLTTELSSRRARALGRGIRSCRCFCFSIQPDPHCAWRGAVVAPQSTPLTPKIGYKESFLSIYYNRSMNKPHT